MRTARTRACGSRLAITVSILAGAGIVRADLTPDVKYDYLGGTYWAVNVSKDKGVSYGAVLSGMQKWQRIAPSTSDGFVTTAVGSGLPSPLYTFCTDIGVYLTDPTIFNYTGFLGQDGVAPPWGAGTPPLNPGAGIENAAYLYNTFTGGASMWGTQDGAALQLAIWEVLYDSTAYGATVDPSYFTTGTIRATATTGTAQAAILAKADTYIDALVASHFNGGIEGYWLQPVVKNSGGSWDEASAQGLLVVVPEPATYIAGLLLGLPVGVNALRFLRRRREV